MMNRSPVRRWSTACTLCCGAAAGGLAVGADLPDSDVVVVTATRTAEASADLPVAINRVGTSQIRDGNLQVNLSEALNAVPGVSAQNRQNYAQDLQLSVRGFGARSSFGVRGVRLYADGIPGTMPDGQGQFSHFDLGSAERVEVLRGPFSALYGNSSGGVIAVFTEDAPPTAQLQATVDYGAFGTRRAALKATGRPQGVNLVVDVAHFETTGDRDHSAAERNNANLKARWQVDGRSTLTLIANWVDLPDAQDPLGLTRSQRAVNPRQAGVNALAYNTRKFVQQQQLGLNYQRQFSAADELSAMFYGGQRSTTQFQAIPKASETPPTHPGGVIDLGRGYWGADVHATAHRALAGTALQLTAGLSFDDLDEARRGYLNFVGTQLGVEGQLRRSEANRVYDLDEYLQLQWDPGPRWRWSAGLRNSQVNIRSHDHLATSGVKPAAVHYRAVNPVTGVTYRAAPGLNVYGAYGQGFETPTLNDLAYRSTDGTLPGLNFALRPARSDNYELGMKSAFGRAQLRVDGFYIQTRDELAVLANAGGRSVFQNIPGTRRRGAEFELNWVGTGDFSSRLAYTYLQAQVTEPYLTCSGLPCSLVPVNAGQRLPAVPAGNLNAALTWRPRPAGLVLIVEAINRTQIYVNDRNSDAAAGYWLANLHLDLAQESSRWHCTESLRVDNLFDRDYVDSVIVNESNARYFEPQPGRAVYVMFGATLRQPRLRR